MKRNNGTSKEDICQNQFTAYVVLAVKRKRSAYIKKKKREQSQIEQVEKVIEQKEIEAINYGILNERSIQNKKLVTAMQYLNAKEKAVVILHILHGTTFGELAKTMNLTEKGVASIYYRSIKKMRQGERTE